MRSSLTFLAGRVSSHAAGTHARVFDRGHDLLALTSDELDVRVPRLLAAMKCVPSFTLVLQRALNIGVEVAQLGAEVVQKRLLGLEPWGHGCLQRSSAMPIASLHSSGSGAMMSTALLSTRSS